MTRLPRKCRNDSRLGGEPKRCFRTLADAEAYINGGLGMNAYHCAHCNNYHVGHVLGTKYGRRAKVTP